MGDSSSTARFDSTSPNGATPSRFRSRSSLDYLLRTVQQTQIRHSGMADAKANMMITVSSIVFSITINQIGNQSYRWPLITLCVFSLGSLIAAILTVMPSGTRTSIAPKPGTPAFNLLFFGHFTSLSQDEFIDEIARVGHTDDTLYETICRDIYGAGTVLARRKYFRLRISYVCFLVGIFVTATELVVNLLGG